MNSRRFRGMLLFMLLFALTYYVLTTEMGPPGGEPEEITYSQFLDMARDGELSDVVLDSQNSVITGKTADGDFSTVMVPMDLTLAERLNEWGVDFEAEEPSSPFLENFLMYWAPTIAVVVIFYFLFIRQFQATGNRAFSFGKSRAKLLSEFRPKVTFSDVAGVEEAKRELEEIIDFLKEPQKFTKLGARIPKGVLVVGPPGTGKTLLAKAVAGEANVPFLSISGSDFVEMFVGVGASRVRDLFEQGKKLAPCIIFIDEIDAVGRHRGWGLGGGHDEREQTLNALLVEMDGFDSKEGVILIAATNRPDILDPALLRPGRFDRRVVVDLPDLEGRRGILKVHTQNIPLGEGIDLGVIARGTPFFSGADLANLCNEAALLAARRNRAFIAMPDLEEARDKVMMGPERRSRTVSEKEKRIVAYHEAGHALVARRLPGTDPIHKVTLIPRGIGMLGGTYQLPERDKYLKEKGEYLNDICVLLGGRVAEEQAFGEVTGGAGNDLKRATELARKMVCEWGMSNEMGPLTYGDVQEHVFLGREVARKQNYSEDTARKIDGEVRRIITVSHERATRILTDERAALDRLAAALIEREILDSGEVDLAIKGEPLPSRKTGEDENRSVPVRPVGEEVPVPPPSSEPIVSPQPA